MALESARTIVAENGVAALSGRKVTKRMGYTIGTLYQIFGGMDDLVEKMNARTLAALYDNCVGSAEIEPVSERLKGFAFSFIEFAKQHPNEWNAVMSYRYGEDHKFSEDYNREIYRLFNLMIDATQHLYEEDEQAEHSADMAVLWASMTGIFSVEASERQVGGLTLEQMLDRLIQLYLSART